MTEVNTLIEREDYTSAIVKLDEMESTFAKNINSDVHVEYAISILKNIKQEKRSRYLTAKDLLEKAVNLNPKNKEAKTYYLMVLKLSQNV